MEEKPFSDVTVTDTLSAVTSCSPGQVPLTDYKEIRYNVREQLNKVSNVSTCQPSNYRLFISA